MKRVASNKFTVLYSDNYGDVQFIIKKRTRPVILCTKLLYKNISIPPCQIVVLENFNMTDEFIIQSAFRGMMNFTDYDF